MSKFPLVAPLNGNVCNILFYRKYSGGFPVLVLVGRPHQRFASALTNIIAVMILIAAPTSIYNLDGLEHDTFYHVRAR